MNAVAEQSTSHPSTVTLYPINTYWPGKGGIFRGILPGIDGGADRLILEHVTELPIGNFKAALADAAEIEADGHKDFHVPDRAESALLYATAKSAHNRDDWYWTREPYGASDAWVQYFNYGGQDWDGQSNDDRAVAVRSEPIQ